MQEPIEMNTLSDGIIPPSSTDIRPWRYLLDIRLWLICVAFIVVGILSLNDTMLYTPDCPKYLIWAKSLAAMEGFKDTSNPEPVRYVVHAPLFPILLAPLAWFFSNITVPAKMLTLLFGVALILLFYLWTATRAGRSPALVGAFLLASNPLVVMFSSHVLSDIPFALFMVMSFMLVEKMIKAPSEDKWAWMFVIVLTMGIFLREIGLSLLFGTLSYLWLRKERRRLLLVFTIPVFFYLVWYFRNEVFVGGSENPPMRNMAVFVSHIFTTDEASLVDEFVARLRINLAVYVNMAKGLILFPEFLVRATPVVVTTEPMMSAMTKVLRFAQYPLMIVQFGLFGWGFFQQWKRDHATLLSVMFSFFYLLIVFLYPINDIRFLTPILVLMLYYAVIGGSDLLQRLVESSNPRATLKIIGVLSLLLLSIPNFVWIRSYVANNRAYLDAISDNSNHFAGLSALPELYTRPPSLVGKWIAENSDSSTTVLARWKELTFWLKNRKIVEVDALIPLSVLEGLLRDYNVSYIVSLTDEQGIGIREFEFQMSQSKRFTFVPVYRVGRYEVIRVDPVVRNWPIRGASTHTQAVQPTTGTSGRGHGSRELFQLGVKLLEDGKYAQATSVFDVLWRVTKGSGYVALFKGISLEFNNDFQQAKDIFGDYRPLPQVGSFLKHAWFHEMFIRDLENALKDSSKAIKAMVYHKVSANYWELGFRRRAFEVLDLSLRADSNFTPALIFGMYYSLQLEDTVKARWYFKRTQKADPNHTILAPVGRIFAFLDSIAHAGSSEKQRDYALGLAKSYAAVGIREVAIELCLTILQQDPQNIAALDLLAQSYEVKRRRWPAMKALERLVALKPGDPIARSRLEELKNQM